jgi:hypothetical protein
MGKKVLIMGISTIILIAIFLLFFNPENGTKNLKINYDDKTWLKITVWGDDGYTVKKTDKKLYIHVGIVSYDPSKTGKCPYAEVEVNGCGVNYKGKTDEGGDLCIPVEYSNSGELTIKCKYKNYENSIIVSVE